jgi:HD-GYP domain-containing protein (c-di-GMP phosphodiesterase class II)
MKIAMDKLCYIFSNALDIIEEEMVGASERHSMRVAALCAAMGKRLGYEGEALQALSVCALFHDNALTEYNLSVMKGALREQGLIMHCENGQKNIEAWLPFKNSIEGYILYHHERGNGKGPFGKREGEYPMEAALIAAADIVDVTCHLQREPAAGLSRLKASIESQAESYSTKPAIAALLDVLDAEMLESLRDENISQTLQQCLPPWDAEMTDPAIVRIANFISRVIDFKSEFTRMHTTQIANRAWLMANHYGYGHEERAALFLAASLHDIGKIATPSEILEKQGPLDSEEFLIIKNHVKLTHDWLGQVPNFEPVRSWAADHHEKLNGSGYSNGKKENELDFNARLIACLDIYQAVCEPRPYHRARPHSDTMMILNDMANKGLVDDKIAKDLGIVMEEYSMRELEPPAID